MAELTTYVALFRLLLAEMLFRSVTDLHKRAL
jgi:hypothetical protein